MSATKERPAALPNDWPRLVTTDRDYRNCRTSQPCATSRDVKSCDKRDICRSLSDVADTSHSQEATSLKDLCGVSLKTVGGSALLPSIRLAMYPPGVFYLFKRGRLVKSHSLFKREKKEAVLFSRKEN
jgi:hypothetical protein